MKSSSRHRWTLLPFIALLLALCLCFWWWQNAHGTVGGKIALEKSLWLFTALVHFFLIPGWLWRDQSLDRKSRNFCGIFLAGFALRAVVEMPLLLTTHIWRCWHGLAHDAIMLAFVFICAVKVPDTIVRRFAALLVLVLLCEGWNAWMFGQVGSPQTGIYFADDSARFAFLNLVTRWELLACLLLMGAWLRSYIKGHRS